MIREIVEMLNMIEEIIKVAIYHYVDKNEINEIKELEYGLKSTIECIEEIKEDLNILY